MFEIRNTGEASRRDQSETSPEPNMVQGKHECSKYKLLKQTGDSFGPFSFRF